MLMNDTLHFKVNLYSIAPSIDAMRRDDQMYEAAVKTPKVVTETTIPAISPLWIQSAVF